MNKEDLIEYVKMLRASLKKLVDCLKEQERDAQLKLQVLRKIVKNASKKRPRKTVYKRCRHNQGYL